MYVKKSRRVRFSRRRTVISRKRAARTSLRRFHKRRRLSTKLGRNFGYGVGNEKVVKCKYTGVVNYSYPANVSTMNTMGNSSIIFLNSPYDPDYSSTGTFNLSSAGYKLWSKLFSNYVVLGAKVIYTLRLKKPFVYTSSTTTATQVNSGNRAFKWGVKIDDDASISGYTNWQEIWSDPWNKSRTLGPQPVFGSRSSTIVQKFSPRKFFGIKDVRDDDIAGAGVGSNPTRPAYSIPWIQPLDQVDSDGNAVDFQLEITLYQTVLFRRPKDYSNLNSADALIEV